MMNDEKIVLDIRSCIYAHAMERVLMQKLDDCQIVISESPDATAGWCKTHLPGVPRNAIFHTKTC